MQITVETLTLVRVSFCALNITAQNYVKIQMSHLTRLYNKILFGNG